MPHPYPQAPLSLPPWLVWAAPGGFSFSCVPTAHITPLCEWGGAGGQPQPPQAGRLCLGWVVLGWCWEVPVFLTQLLTEQRFVLSQQAQPWAGTHLPART